MADRRDNSNNRYKLFYYCPYFKKLHFKTKTISCHNIGIMYAPKKFLCRYYFQQTKSLFKIQAKF